MENTIFSRWTWSFWVHVFHFAGSVVLPFAGKLPEKEAEKLLPAAHSGEVLIIFNSGGWGDTPLERADDFTPILKSMQKLIRHLGYSSNVIAYTRTLSNLRGRMAGVKEQLNSFKSGSQILADDVKQLVERFPEKKFIIAGFSTGGGFTSGAMKNLGNNPNVYGISVGVPAWFNTYSSERSLVLDNCGLDPICAGDANAIALAVLKAPFKWINARLKGQKLSFALSVQIPHHEYSWASPEVGRPINNFLEDNLRKKNDRFQLSRRSLS